MFVTVTVFFLFSRPFSLALLYFSSPFHFFVAVVNFGNFLFTTTIFTDVAVCMDAIPAFFQMYVCLRAFFCFSFWAWHCILTFTFYIVCSFRSSLANVSFVVVFLFLSLFDGEYFVSRYLISTCAGLLFFARFSNGWISCNTHIIIYPI